MGALSLQNQTPSRAKTTPLVSVVVPTYNRAHQMGRSIESALAQTYPSVEVIVVDDGSSDDTAAVMAQNYGHDPRVRYAHRQNGGPAAARNTGMTAARGAYIAFLDSDDTWMPWKLELQIACMEQHPELVMTWTDMEAVDASGQLADPAYLRKMYGAYDNFTNAEMFASEQPLAQVAPRLAGVVGDAQLRIGNLFSKMIVGNLVHTSTVVLRRALLDKLKGMDESLRPSGEDYEFHLRTTREGLVGLIDLPAIRYQQGMPDRLTARRYGIFMAENTLRTIAPIIRSEREAIDLPPAMIRHALAKAHAWIAFEHLELGNAARARTHYLLSLMQEPFQPRLAKQLAFAALPFGAGVALRRRLQAFKARRRSSSSDRQ